MATEAGFKVILSNSRGPKAVSSLVTELGALARAATPDEAARDADLVVASIPFVTYQKLPADALAGKVVIDMNRHLPDVQLTPNLPTTDASLRGPRSVQSQLPSPAAVARLYATGRSRGKL